MKNFVEKGDSIDVVLDDDVKGGDLVITGSVVGVAVSDGDGVNLRTVATKGVFTLPKAAGAITQGAKVYWVTADSNISTTATDNTFVGYAWGAAASADETVNVALANSL